MEHLEPWYTQVDAVVQKLKETFARGGRVYVAGNGGSATLAQHLSDEMVGRYESDRPAYPVIALTADSAVLTVIGNDYGYENVFKRQIEALGQRGDMFMAFSTSGSSQNIISAAQAATERDMSVVTFTGPSGVLKDMADVAVISPAKATSRIQELDLHAIHLICESFEPETKQRRLGMDRIEEIVGSFSGKKILVVGDVMLDQYVAGTVDRVNPEAPVPVLHAHQEQVVTGGAGNAAKNAARLGAKTLLVSVIGRDAMGELLEKTAAQEGYEARFIHSTTRPTIYKTRFLAKIRESEVLGGSNLMEGSQQLLRVDHEEKRDIEPALEGQVIAAIREAAAAGAEGILVSDYNKGVITKNVAEAIMVIARERGIPVAADLKPSHAPLFIGAAVVSPNRKEAHEFLGLDAVSDPISPQELAARLREMMQGTVCVTLGPDGMQVCDEATNEHVPQEHVVKVYDVSGAGDTAIVTLLLARLAGASAAEAARVANAAAAIVVGRVGTAAASPDELRSMLMHRYK